MGLAAVALWAGGPTVHAQARRIDKIPKAAKTTSAEPVDAGALPSRADCESTVLQIAAAYGPDRLEPWLHERFPNRRELLDSLARLDQRVSGLQLHVDGIERVSIGAWKLDHGRAVCDCVVDLHARLVFDHAQSGRRTTAGPRRGQWVVRFERGGAGAAR